MMVCDTPKHAKDCKYYFGDDYDMYCSYLKQAVQPPHEITPVSEGIYYALDAPNEAPDEENDYYD